ncbi:cation:proton antiporter [Leisingera daeponensis]|uniref:cation:proton antiporter n=1 Tax=Leisingera daeponensis TaxID=405746 RepID=UPI001C971AC4|nr:cation:proton antiporter [Leisingera daeponensis]MBY6058702.1 cation:proton antiporter [Leisingera daeponensis]
MDHTEFFEFAPYHLMLAAAGAVIILAHWLPRLVSSREPAAAPLLILLGMAAFWLVPGSPAVPDPRLNPKPWEIVSELTVIVALFAAGLRLDSLRPWKRWGPTLRLLLIGMPLTIAAVALLGWGIGGMTAAGAILLGAVLAPTDPVLAGDVQVGPPLKGGEHPVRFTLTTEAALNDGLAFPFVYLGLIVALQGLDPQGWLLHWAAIDVVYRIAAGAAMGICGGWVLGQVLFIYPGNAALANTGSGVVALAGVLLCYGSTELVEGYGFIAVAAMGLTLRRIENEHRFHLRLHNFCETIEHALTALLLVALGNVLPVILGDLTSALVLIAVLLIVLIRPAAGWLSLAGTRLGRRDRAVISVFGVRGIGSIYYLCYAGAHIEFVNEPELWSLIGLTILLSTMLHGFTVGRAMDKVANE